MAAIYSPILSAKRAELWALADLDKTPRAHMTPLVDVPRLEPPEGPAVRHRPWSPSGALQNKLEDPSSGVLGCWGTDAPFRLDLGRVDARGFDRPGHPADWAFDLCGDLTLRAVPVTGRDHNADYRLAAARAARRLGHGACIRIRGDDLMAGNAGANVVLRELDLPRSSIDLVFDIGPLPIDRAAIMASVAEQWLSGFRPLTGWRSASIAGGAFPLVLSEIVDYDSQAVIERIDAQMWRLLRERSGLALDFGDYGVVHPSDKPGWRGAANLRYATESQWLVVRGLAPDDTDSAEYARLAADLAQLPRWRGADHCPGCQFIAERAASGGGGNSTQWRQADFAHHFAVVCESLDSG